MKRKLSRLVSGLAVLFLLASYGSAFADATYNISGTVSFNGVAAPGVGVSYGNDTGAGNATTDNNGFYSASGVTAGTYMPSITAQNYTENSVTTGMPNYFDITSPTQSVTVNSDTTQNLSFATATISATVEYASGTVIPNATVIAQPVNSNNSVATTDGMQTFNYGAGQELSQATTDSNGLAAMDVFSGAGYNVCIEGIGPQNSDSDCAYTPSVTVNGNTSVTITVPPTYTVSGNFSFDGTPTPSGLNLYINDNNDSNNGGLVGNASATTTSNGNYTVNNLPAGIYDSQLSYQNSSEDSSSTGVPNTFQLNSESPTINVAGNTSQNFPFTTVPVNTYVEDANGNPINGASVTVTNANVFTVATTDGQTSYKLFPGDEQSNGTTNSAGSTTLNVFPGGQYTTCATYSSENSCQTSGIEASASLRLDVSSSAPAAPANLNLATLSQYPTISWSSVSGATSYNVYRDGIKVANTSNTTFADTAATKGTYSYFVTAVSLTGAESNASPLLEVAVGTLPTITSATSASTGMRVPFSFAVTTTGDPTPSLSESGALPSGLSFVDNGDGTATISGTAATGTNGNYPVTISAGNGMGTSATQNFTLTITTSTSTPAITSANSTMVTYNMPFSFTVKTTGYPAPSLTRTGALPTGVTFTDNGNGTATISGTPTSIGTFNTTIKATNSVGNATQAFALTVTRSPVIKPVSTKTATVGTAFATTITASGSPTPSITESGTLPSGIAFTDNGNGTAKLSGTPRTGSGGSYTVTVTATNSLGSTSQAFTLSVREAPVITSSPGAVATTGTGFSFQVTASGFPAPAITKIGKLPSGLVYGSSTGRITGTPAAGTKGTYNLFFTAKNSVGAYSKNFTLTVH